MFHIGTVKKEKVERKYKERKYHGTHKAADATAEKKSPRMLS